AVAGDGRRQGGDAGQAEGGRPQHSCRARPKWPRRGFGRRRRHRPFVAAPMKESSCTQVLTAGELAAVFLPGQGMLGASLQLAGRELLGRVEDLASAAAKGGTA